MSLTLSVLDKHLHLTFSRLALLTCVIVYVSEQWTDGRNEP